jgi:hypothetical protein
MKARPFLKAMNPIITGNTTGIRATTSFNTAVRSIPVKSIIDVALPT